MSTEGLDMDRRFHVYTLWTQALCRQDEGAGGLIARKTGLIVRLVWSQHYTAIYTCTNSAQSQSTIAVCTCTSDWEWMHN